MRTIFPVLLLLGGCAPPDADQLRVLQLLDDGSYEVLPTEVPSLKDPYHLVGDLGTGYQGGALGLSGYKQGGTVRLDHTVTDGVATALTEDGLIFWSFYAHLDELNTELTDKGYDLEPIFPFDGFAYNPVSIMDFQAAENAAYAPAGHVFILFPDLLEDVPLAANSGIVRHEFGHAWFQWLTEGELRTTGDTSTLDAKAVNERRALNEGFADTLATLSLDHPTFMEASLNQPSRDVRGSWVATSDLYYSEGSAEEDPLGLSSLSYDPYALGSVFAALAWDIRVGSDDPDWTLEIVVATTEQWGQGGLSADVNEWAAMLVEAAQERPAAGQAACIGYAFRFPLGRGVPSCF